MVGDQHLGAQRARGRHAFDAGHAVVDGDDQRGLPRTRLFDQAGRQAVAVAEAVGHQEIHVRETPLAQRLHHQRGAGGAIGVEVADDQHAALRVAQQQFGRFAAHSPASPPAASHRAR